MRAADQRRPLPWRSSSFPAGNPSGVVGPHDDLGLFEFALSGALLAGMVVLLRKPRQPGWIVGVIAVDGPALPRADAGAVELCRDGGSGDRAVCLAGDAS